MQSSALVKSNKITTGNKITAYSLGKALTCKVMPICSCSISKEALKVPLSLSAISFCFYFGPPAPCHRFISFFFPARPGRKGVWAQHELASAGYLQSPAICQHGTNQHFTPTPLRSNRLWRRQKGTWCDGDMKCVKEKKKEEGEKKTEIEAENKRKQEGSFLLSFLNLP